MGKNSILCLTKIPGIKVKSFKISKILTKTNQKLKFYAHFQSRQSANRGKIRTESTLLFLKHLTTENPEFVKDQGI